MNMKYWIIYNIRVYVMFNQIPLKKQQVLPPPTPLIIPNYSKNVFQVNFDLFSKLLMVLASCCLFQTLGFLDIVALYYIGMVFTILQGILHCSSVGSCFWVAFQKMFRIKNFKNICFSYNVPNIDSTRRSMQKKDAKTNALQRLFLARFSIVLVLRCCKV